MKSIRLAAHPREHSGWAKLLEIEILGLAHISGDSYRFDSELEELERPVPQHL